MRMTRRKFAATVGAAAASSIARPVRAAGKQSSSLRVIAYNVYKCQGWPEGRPLAKKAVADAQMAVRLALQLKLYEPDVVSFSESPSEKLTREIAGVLGMHHVRFPSGGYWPGTLLSRFEIADSQNVPLGYERPKDLFTRHWGRGDVKLPSGETLIIHSAHLYPGADPAVRLKEAPAMLASMKPDLEAGRSMLLIGDLNLRPESQEYKLLINAGWTDTFAKVGRGDGFTIPSDLPKHRIDYVMAAGPIADRIAESRPLFEGAFRLNVADAHTFALSDHLPQFAAFSSNR